MLLITSHKAFKIPYEKLPHINTGMNNPRNLRGVSGGIFMKLRIRMLHTYRIAETTSHPKPKTTAHQNLFISAPLSETIERLLQAPPIRAIPKSTVDSTPTTKTKK